MNHFNFKSLAFYGVAIGTVLLLFQTVTAYGEKNLQASPVINGRYRLTLAENLPNCEKSDPLILNIQQSGIYFNASLLPATAIADTDEKHSLTGILKNQQLSLAGRVERSILCNVPRPQDDPIKSITIKMQLLDKGSIKGQLAVSGISQTQEFTAMPEQTKEKSQKSNTH